jgi:hypothetical protein
MRVDTRRARKKKQGAYVEGLDALLNVVTVIERIDEEIHATLAEIAGDPLN